MRKSGFISITVSILTAVLVIACSQAENKNATAKPTAAPTQTAAPIVSTPASPTATTLVPNTTPTPVPLLKNLPPEGGDKPTKAEFDGYAYSYKKDGEKTVATFDPKLLPAETDIAVRAIRDVINRSYGDRLESDLHIEGTGPGQTIRITSSKHQYVVVGVKEPTGEFHTLIITQLN